MNYERAAMLIIDMQNAFIEEESPLCIKGAKPTIPACAKALETARERGIPVFYIKRQYREDGSDVEITRRKVWENGKPLAPGSTGPLSEEFSAELTPKDGDYVIVKPRWSAFFGTELDIMLRGLDVNTVILTGTTTPNCVRTTCYDANSLNYNVVILEDCTSSMTEEIQKANIEDMERMGAVILQSTDW
ncbi:MAG: cysteine hydrolase [Firmicutes bacterium]|nr:cysteine hydrolase [Bacillota bacterium]